MAAEGRYSLRAEAVRDVGILLFVFVPLDVLVQHKLTSWWHWLIVFFGCCFSLFLIEVGVRMGSEE